MNEKKLLAATREQLKIMGCNCQPDLVVVKNIVNVYHDDWCRVIDVLENQTTVIFPRRGK